MSVSHNAQFGAGWELIAISVAQQFGIQGGEAGPDLVDRGHGTGTTGAQVEQ
jgi:hypothetical protein